jgi:DNA-binding NtrC family response regulator
MKRPPILVIDDDESITSTIEAFLMAKGYEVTVANDGEEALGRVREGRFPVVISDIYIDQVTGLDILEEARRSGQDSAVILMTARGSVRTTVDAELGGAFEYLAKPFEMRALLGVIERAATYLSEPSPEPEDSEDLEQFGKMVGFSPPMVEVYKKIARSARSQDTVLIVGETGVGKELVARAIHDHGPRSSAPFVAVDSGAVPGTLWESEIFGSIRGAFTGADRDRPGVIETARGGTVFFDEIGEIPTDFQPKLLRFLQEKEYRPVGSGSPRKADVRIIAATNRPLEAMIRDGKFREDLFYRLNVLRIDVPPLRDRRSDISFLVKRFLDETTAAAHKRVWLEETAGRLLEEHAWPGNVRQLQNTIQRLVALNPPGPISADSLRPLLSEPPMEAEEEETSAELSEVERRQILRVLEETGGNKTKAAELLGIQRRTLYKKLARLARERDIPPENPE